MQSLQVRPLIPSRRELVARVFRQRTVFLACFALVVLGFLLTGQFTPKYRSEMKIRVRKARVDPVVTVGQDSTPQLQGLGVREEELNSEVELIRGEDLLREVVLEAGLVSPENATSMITVAKALRKLQRGLEVSAITKTDLIAVHYESNNPEQSRRVLATLATLYLNKQRNLPASAFQVSFFDQQVRRHGIALDLVQAKLLDFTKKTGIISADLERDLTVRQVKTLAEERMETSAAVADAQAEARQIAIQMLTTPERIFTESKTGDNPQLLNGLKTTLLTLELKRTELLNKYDPNYRLVKDVDREIATTENALRAQASAPVREDTSNMNPTRLELESALTKSRTLLAGLHAKETQLSLLTNTLGSSARDLEQKEVEQASLLRSAKTEQDMYQLYVDKLEQAKTINSLDREGILNVALAQEPVTPALPTNSRLSVLMATLFSGGLLSFGAALLSDLMDPTIRNADELAETTHSPLLAEFSRRNRIHAS